MNRNVSLFFEEAGRGVPLVCLHGYPLDHTIWLPLVREMRQEARFILPDLRGHGRSPALEGQYSMCSMAEDVVRLLDRLEIERAVLAGHSMGGYVALAFARHFSDRLLGMALVASHAFADPPEKQAERLKTAEDVLKNGTSQLVGMAEKLTTQPHLVAEMRQLILKASAQGVAGVLTGIAERQDETALLASLHVPVVLIAGGQDQIIPLDWSRRMGAVLPTDHYFEITSAGHLPMLEATLETSQALKTLLAQVSG